MHDWAAGTVANARHLITNPSTHALVDSFPHRSAVVCAAGPSLSKQLPTLARFRDRLVVIAIGQSLRALREAGIEPDLVFVAESQDVAHQLTDAGDLGDLQLVLPPQAHASLFELPVGQHWIAFQNTNPFGCWLAQQLGQDVFVPSAGNRRTVRDPPRTGTRVPTDPADRAGPGLYGGSNLRPGQRLCRSDFPRDEEGSLRVHESRGQAGRAGPQ